MNNRFYNDYDRETLGGPRDTGYRSQFQADRDRLIYTSAFRRLQAKTQVFLAGEQDFYRTRLTHSLEVAQIGRSICHWLLHLGDPLADDFQIDADLVEAVCLAHDLGHPPFGHAGERSLNRFMAPYGGFEGNAQTLRIVTETIYSSGDKPRGMQPTRAFLDGILKYKTLHRELENPPNHFLYDEQEPILDFALGAPVPSLGLAPGPERDRFRSIECQIMDWADDTAYSLNDVVDGVRAGFLTMETISRWAEKTQRSGDDAADIEELLRALREGKVESRLGRKIGFFIKATKLETAPENPASGQTNRHRFRLTIEPAVRRERRLYSEMARDLVFRSPALHHLEHKGDFLLRRIFDLFRERHIDGTGPEQMDFLPADVSARIKTAGGSRQRARVICDYLAGMTDAFAVRFYKRLFSPEFGTLG